MTADGAKTINVPVGALLVSFATAAVSGYVALRVLLRLLLAKRFSVFAWYLFPAAALLAALRLFA